MWECGVGVISRSDERFGRGRRSDHEPLFCGNSWRCRYTHITSTGPNRVESNPSPITWYKVVNVIVEDSDTGEREDVEIDKNIINIFLF